MQRAWSILMHAVDAANSILSYHLVFTAAFTLILVATVWKLA